MTKTLYIKSNNNGRITEMTFTQPEGRSVKAKIYIHDNGIKKSLCFKCHDSIYISDIEDKLIAFRKDCISMAHTLGKETIDGVPVYKTKEITIPDNKAAHLFIVAAQSADGIYISIGTRRQVINSVVDEVFSKDKIKPQLETDVYYMGYKESYKK